MNTVFSAFPGMATQAAAAPYLVMMPGAPAAAPIVQPQSPPINVVDAHSFVKYMLEQQQAEAAATAAATTTTTAAAAITTPAAPTLVAVPEPAAAATSTPLTTEEVKEMLPWETAAGKDLSDLVGSSGTKKNKKSLRKPGSYQDIKRRIQEMVDKKKATEAKKLAQEKAKNAAPNQIRFGKIDAAATKKSAAPASSRVILNGKTIAFAGSFAKGSGSVAGHILARANGARVTSSLSLKGLDMLVCGSDCEKKMELAKKAGVRTVSAATFLASCKKQKA